MPNANMSKDELLNYCDQLESENADLQDALDGIAAIISAPADNDTDDDDDGDGQD